VKISFEVISPSRINPGGFDRGDDATEYDNLRKTTSITAIKDKRNRFMFGS